MLFDHNQTNGLGSSESSFTTFNKNPVVQSYLNNSDMVNNEEANKLLEDIKKKIDESSPISGGTKLLLVAGSLAIAFFIFKKKRKAKNG